MKDELRQRILQLERRSRALDPGAGRRRRLRNAVIASSERFLRRVRSLRGFVETADRGSGITELPITPDGVSIDRAIATFERYVVHPGGNPPSPGYLAYIPGGGLYHSALGDFIAAVTNKYAGVFFAGPGAVRMENMLVRWVADLVGYPAGAGGSIASGGSIANLSAIVTAREQHRLKSADHARAVVYATAQTHHSIDRALRIAGLGEAVLHRVPMDDRFRMDVDALARAVSEDRNNGLLPWLIVANAGSTDTGAVDPLDAIADIAAREHCWYHVDAAYGGFFLLTEHGREMLKGIERSDSTVLDPHKGMFLPFGTGIVLVRDARALAASHAYSAAYMQDAEVAADEVSPADVSPELTKHFRAVRMWLPLVVAGTNPFRAALEEKLLLARYFHEQIARAGFTTGPEPDLSIVTFRWEPEGMSLDESNRVNRELLDAVRKDGRIFLSSTMLDGKFTLRLAVLAHRTHLRTIDMATEILREKALAIGGC